MRHFITVVLITTLFHLVGCGSSKEPQVSNIIPQYDAATFYETTSVGGTDINHTADALLVTSDASGVFNVYRYPIDGSEPTQLTQSTTNAISGISWFPKDDRIIATADEGGNELNHIYVRELDGQLIDITPGKLKAMFMGWSGDKTHFYVAMNKRDPKYFDVYKYSTKDYSSSMLFENSIGIYPTFISKDGKWLTAVRENNNFDTDILLMSLTTQNVINLGENQRSVMSPKSFSPDSTTLYFTSDQNSEFAQPMSYDLKSGKVTSLGNYDWDVMYLYQSESGRYSVMGINEDAETKVTITNSKGIEFLIPNLPDGNISSVSFSDDESMVSFALRSDTSPTNIYVYKVGSASPKRLTDTLSPKIDEQFMVASDVVRFESYDGMVVPGLLYKPKQASSRNKVPVLIMIHGGPGGQSRKGYSAMRQHLINHGYAAFAVNNRGSSGYGKTFFHADDRKHGEADLGDIVAAKKYLKTLDWVDQDKIALIGGSYGGYLTMAGMAFTDEFAAGINIFGVTNWVRTVKSIPPWWEAAKRRLYDEIGDPATDEERLYRISPLFHADKIKSPVLVVQGANDPRVLQIESDEMVEAMRKNNVDVEYLLFDDEGHGFRKKANRIAASQAYVDFLEKYL